MMTCVSAALVVPLPTSHHPLSARPPTSKAFHPPTAFFSSTNADRTTWAAPLSSVRRGRGFGLSATASGRRRGGRMEAGVVSDDEDNDGWDEEGDGDEPLMPLEEMARWLENKPAGFGEGKTYDTTLEEQLLEEMERSKKAQLANINKLKKEAKSAAAARPKKPEPHAIPSTVRVRMWNLPRKKNIHRDLLLAFKGFSGIVNIGPAVSGNQKTRDPICKGFAFFDFDSEEAANRFVQKYSNTHVLFGKVKKQITCIVINSRGSSACEQSVDGIQTFSQPKFSDLGAEVPTRSDMNKLSQNSYGESIDIAVVDKTGQECVLIENGTDGPLSRFEAIETGILHSDASLSYDVEKGCDKNADALDSNLSTPLQRQRKQKDSKKKTIKKISAKASNTSLPGSVTRLKIRERAVLTGVLSKYGGKVAVPLSK